MHFQHLWWYAAGTAALAGLTCSLIGRKPRAQAPAPAPESRAAVSAV
jgi:hypothetical protein